MRFFLLAALAVLPQQSPSSDVPTRYRDWQWQRSIQPSASAPGDTQCVVLDAKLYADAAPGLRDVRLLQNGREIAYALQESYDERAQHTAYSGDRSLYTTVLKVPLTDAGPLQHGEAVLLQHVPVERMELTLDEDTPAKPNSTAGRVRFRLVATPYSHVALNARQPATGEVIEDDLDAQSPIEQTAIGANLQGSARIDITVKAGPQHFTSASLQMHQRSLCFQPLSSAPLMLLYGNAGALPVRYAYAAHYQPRAETLLASLGPAQPSGSYQPRVNRAFTLTRRQRLGLAVFIAVGGFLVTAVPLLRRR